ncbi:hypothetical protein FHS57_001582 [Runella defluvii]|uniref:Uncharacterized protein n=1 Tax=Runella defluvii TaxID=370973 RepID=A0A7W6EPG4_9BACT|nr:hypothetical protein [Runella defluvii]MBB3837585.1 hypothetical protein [Runella defluvii]
MPQSYYRFLQLKASFLFHWGIVFVCFQAHAQEGRPALAIETAESQRVKSIIKNALPHQLENWAIERESDTDGDTWFHNGSVGYSSFFSHEFKIRYVRKNVSEDEKNKWRTIAVDMAGIQKMMDETECEIDVYVNAFENELTTQGSLHPKPIPPFPFVMVGPHDARLCMGKGWKVAKTTPLDDGQTLYRFEMPPSFTVPMTQIQSILILVKGSPTVLDFFLKNTDLKALKDLMGENKIPIPNPSQAPPMEKTLAKPLAGTNEIEFTLNGGDFNQRTVRLKPSVDNQFGYLRNNHPNRAITENAITRILISEDSDFKTYTSAGFLDITIPFIRQTGQFETFPGSEKSSFRGGINCWNGCEYSFDSNGVTIKITSYDPVGGFIEGTFEGDVKVGYKIHEPIGTDQQKRPDAHIKGHFKVRRQKDRY